MKDEKTKAPVFTPNQMKDCTIKRFPRYVRTKSYNVPEHKDDQVQSIVTAFLKRQITSQEFQNSLRDNKINPNIEEVYKFNHR